MVLYGQNYCSVVLFANFSQYLRFCIYRLDKFLFIPNLQYGWYLVQLVPVLVRIPVHYNSIPGTYITRLLFFKKIKRSVDS